MKTSILDANIVIRYLTNDDPDLFIKAKQYFIDAASNKSKIYLDTVTIAEIIWVLKSFYKYPRLQIAQLLSTMMLQNWILSDRKSLILSSLHFFSAHNLSYIDCYLHCLSESKDFPLATFDTKLAKLK